MVEAPTRQARRLAGRTGRRWRDDRVSMGEMCVMEHFERAEAAHLILKRRVA